MKNLSVHLAALRDAAKYEAHRREGEELARLAALSCAWCQHVLPEGFDMLDDCPSCGALTS